MDTTERTSSWRTWNRLYSWAWTDPDVLTTAACPECGATGGLRLLFHPGASEGVASGTLGCDTCVTGIGLCRVPVPGWATPAPYNPDDTPNYRLLPPR